MRTPKFIIELDGNEATGTLGKRLQSAKVTDGAGWSADSLILKFDNADGRMEIPFPECKIRFKLGFADGELRDFGLFHAHKVNTTLAPATVELTCKAISRAAGGEDKQKELFKSARSREWLETDTIDSVLEKISTENGYAAKCGNSLVGVPVPKECIVQNAETDGAFLRRLAEIVRAKLKAFNGFLMLFNPEKDMPQAQESASAADAGTSDAQGATPVEIKVSEISSGEFTVERNDKFQGVKAKWHSTEDAALHEVCVGKGEPYDTLKDEYDSEESARLAAENRLAELNRDARTCTINATADMRVCAEGFVRITGTQNALEGGAWRVKTVTFTLDGGGLKMSFNAGY